MINRIRKTGFNFFLATLFNRIMLQRFFRMRRYGDGPCDLFSKVIVLGKRTDSQKSKLELASHKASDRVDFEIAQRGRERSTGLSFYIFTL